MTEMPESRLYGGLQVLCDKADTKIRELLRWARLSFALRIELSDSGDILVLHHVPQYSRCNEEPPVYYLGAVRCQSKNSDDDLKRGALWVPRADIKRVGLKLAEIIRAHETPPVKDRKEWEMQAYGVPVAVEGVDYFGDIVDRDGPLAPSGLTTYRTNDKDSKRLIERLTR